MEGWSPERIRALRSHLGLTQVEMAEELGMRQQTISEWETGAYQPRGGSIRLLEILAERSGFETEGEPEAPRPRRTVVRREGKTAPEEHEPDWASWAG